VHPIVNAIAGPYYKRGNAREKHRECEVYQDVYAYRQVHRQTQTDFERESFNEWCDIAPGWLSDNAPVWLRYLLQKSFVEAHAIMPSEDSIENWVDGTLTVLRAIDNFGPYVKANGRIGDDNDPLVREYIFLEPPANADHDKKNEYAAIVRGRQYMDIFDEAVNLAVVYLKAAHKLYNENECGKSSEEWCRMRI